ncbi:hypothetical protein CCACVL1_01361 [Corchorus capsularis]|uniref:Uncharacterized protein n=1 Tax=Corchorus capsularis TaxID=210143 RepID=A0A1R3KJA7_COCAP|nr:hypothetical protein CCACVL1_01361 [Corchorus capsularis]
MGLERPEITSVHECAKIFTMD